MTSIFVAPLLLASSLLSAQTVNSPSLAITKDNRTLSVSASDHAEAEPEVAEIHIGFTAYGMTLPETYKAASATSNGIVKALVDAGAQKSEIQSQSQQVARLQDYEVKAQKGMKFRVQQSWTVSVAPKDAALVLDAAIQAGANQSGDINWRMKNSVALDTEAIRRATERARLMATELAKGMGVTLGKPLYATNTVSNGLIAPRMMMSAMARSANSDQVAPLSIEAQRVQSEATVQVIYAIE
ncbi:hypothetical protein SAMN05421771_3055 [Granulicella pectinivorans]|uniref:SIMPL domain-containing protein n=2 Tax=Granulicella pectinivorans TaxID=474950 RepID=A0A1I6MN40_9BACT|nr:hypothetical protein SAMN05421771_3055 [Granulicella pectinivorans]